MRTVCSMRDVTVLGTIAPRSSSSWGIGHRGVATGVRFTSFGARLISAGSDRVLSMSEWFIWGKRARCKTWEVLIVGTKSQGAMYVLSAEPHSM